MFFSLPAIAALLSVAALALFPDARVLSAADMAPDRAALWFLFACALALQFPVLWKRVALSRDGATWVLLCAAFVLFQIAGRAGPHEGFSLKLGFAPDDPLVVPWATWAVVLGALCSFPLWLKRGGAERFVLLGLALVGLFGFGMFRLLASYFSVGATETLVPGPMATLLLQIVSYGALALCCRAAAEEERVRVWVLRALPILLFIVACRHQFAPIAAPAPSPDE
jgi:hypothetical protein